MRGTGWNTVQYSFVTQLGANDVEFVQMRDGTQHNFHFLCNLCR